MTLPIAAASAATSGAYSDEVGGSGVAARAAVTALRNAWDSSVTAAGGTPGAEIVLSTAGSIAGVFHTAVDGTTISVSRTRYTSGAAPVFVSVSPNQGASSCVANGATAGAGMQGGSPRPTALVGGSATCPNGFSYSEVGGAGESTTRDAVEFTFSRPVLAFGAWFGDLETRTDGLGVAALLRLYDSAGVLLSEQGIQPGPSFLPQSGCANATTGCGNDTTRWVGFVADPAQPVSRMVVIVGDEDAAGAALDEGLGFIGPSLDLSRASIHMDKTAAPLTDTNGDLLIGAGDTIAYSFVVTNTGTVLVSSISIIDSSATALNCPPGSVAPNATKACTGSHVLTQAEVDSGSVVNTATANGTAYAGTIHSAPGSATTMIPAAGSLTIVKDVDLASFAAPGTVLTYNISVANAGNVTLTGVDVSDVAPGAGVFDASECDAIATTLVPAASVSCTVTYQTTQADLDAGGVTNTATVTGNAPGGGGGRADQRCCHQQCSPDRDTHPGQDRR